MVEAAVGILQRFGGAEIMDSVRVEVQNLNVSRAVIDPGRVPDLITVWEPDSGFTGEVGRA